jgi:hypothetical protein
MKKIIISFLIAALSLSSVAQVPGYLGKRFSIGYSNYFSPRMSVLVKGLGLIDDRMSTEHLFNSTHCLDMDYILTTKVSLCLSGQFSKTDLFKVGSQFSMHESGTYYNVQYSPRPKEDMGLNTVNISLGFKFFKERYLNPFGRYRKLELIILMSMIQMDEKGFLYQPSDYKNGTPLTSYMLSSGADKFNSLVLAYTLGKQRIFFDKMILDWGIRFGFNFSYVFSVMNPITAGGGLSDNSIENELRNQGNMRIWGAQTVNAHIGLRFLAF